MKLLLIRHAAAIPRGTPGVLDDERPLTPDGKAQVPRRRARARQGHRRPDLLLTSPLPRARATAEIAARAFANIAPTVEPALARSSVDGIVAALKIHPPGARIALVGHEPLLGALLARLLGATQGERLAFATGGAALVDLPDGPAADGRLRWFLKPRILRTLARPDSNRRRPASQADNRSGSETAGGVVDPLEVNRVVVRHVGRHRGSDATVR